METKPLVAAFFLLSLQTFSLGQIAGSTNGKTKTVVGIVGGQVTFMCDLPVSDPPQIAWKDNVWNQARGKEPIFNSSLSGDIVSSHLNKDNMDIDDTYQLTINHLLSGYEEDNTREVSSSGDYFCYSLYESQWLERKFFLSLADKPKCEGVVELREGDHTQLSCSVKYSGNMPNLAWFGNGQQLQSQDNSDVQTAMAGVDVSSATYQDDGSVYTCRMVLGEEAEECSLTINVQYKVRDIKLEPETDILNLGEQIKCSARGNPTPSIEFSPETTSVTAGGGQGTMVVDKTWLHQMTTVHCKASNSLDGRVEIIEKSITFNVTVPKEDSVTGTGSQAPVLSVLLSIISLVITTVIASLSL